MILLTATTMTLEFKLGSAVTTNQLPFVVSYADHTTSAFTPGAQNGVSNSTTNVVLAAAPASSTQRQIKLVNIYNADTVSAAVTVQLNDNGTLRTMLVFTLLAGESLIYHDHEGWKVLDVNGRIKTNEIAVVGLPDLAYSPAFFATGSGVTGPGSGTTAAMYLGVAARSYGSIKVTFRVTTALATAIVWGEIAIAKGAPVLGGNPSLTTVGFLDVTGVVNSTGVKIVTVTVSGVNAGDNLWILYGSQATTPMVIRSGNTADDLTAGSYATAAATRPSTMAAATSFTVGTVVPWIAAQLL